MTNFVVVRRGRLLGALDCRISVRGSQCYGIEILAPSGRSGGAGEQFGVSAENPGGLAWIFAEPALGTWRFRSTCTANDTLFSEFHCDARTVD